MEIPSQTSRHSRSKTIEEYSNLQEISSDVKALAHENFILAQTAEVFERYLRKRNALSLVGMDKFLEQTTSIRNATMLRGSPRGSFSSASGASPSLPLSYLSQSPSSTPHGKTSHSLAHSSLGVSRISALFKIDMVDRELDESRITMDKLKSRFERAKFLLETEEENLKCDITLIMDKKVVLENFIKENTDKKTGKVFYDKFLRFIENELQSGDRDLRKLKLKINSSQVEYNRMVAQQQQKLELRERLHPIDLHKLVIENEELQEKLEQKTKKLMGLKKVVGRKGQNLVSMKSKLNDTLLMLKSTKQAIKQKETKYKFTEEKEIKNVNELITAEIINNSMKKLNLTYKSPDAHDYLMVQVKLNELKSEKEKWERRCKYQKQNISLLEHQLKQLLPPPRFKSQPPSTYSFRSSKSLFSSKSADSVVRHFSHTSHVIPHCTPTTPTFKKW